MPFLSYFILILSITKITLIHSAINTGDLENAIIGSPVVVCEREFIHFSVPTKKPFRGRIYVKGEYSNSDCVRIYDQTENESESAEVHQNEVTSRRNPARDETASAPDNKFFNQPKRAFENYEHGNWRDFLRGSGDPSLSNQNHNINRNKQECPLVCPPCEASRQRRQTKESNAEIDVRLTACNVQRDRTLSPPGLRVSTVVVISFHQSFVTKVDRAYRVDCLYEESSKQVTTQIDVSMPPTVNLMREMQTPRCEYKIKAKNGVDLKNVRVGDEALHEWRCRPAQSNQDDDNTMKDMFSMLVHSCFLDDGQGKKQVIVDSHGCSMDNFIMPTPNYSSNELKAYVTAPVVKFPDRDVVGFQCAISVFMRELEHSPPKCDDNAARNRTKRMVKDENAWELHKQITVLDPETSIDEREDLNSLLNDRLSPAPFNEKSHPVVEFCVSVVAFGFMIASSTFLLTITIGLALATLMLRKQALGNLLRTH